MNLFLKVLSYSLLQDRPHIRFSLIWVGFQATVDLDPPDADIPSGVAYYCSPASTYIP